MSAPGAGERWSIRAAGAALVAAAVTVYWNSRHGPFVFDDVASILENPTIRSLWPLSGPLSPPAEGGYTVSGRPLVNLTLALNWAWGGAAVESYHVFNLGVHVAAGLVLFGLVRRTLARGAGNGRLRASATGVAAVAALLWLVHPLTTAAVSYTIQRAEALMALCWLGTLYAFARSLESKRATGWRVAAVACCAAGMGCKEVMATAPVAVLLYDRAFGAGSLRAAWRERRGFYAALAATWAIVAWLVVGTGGDRGGTFAFSWEAARAHWTAQGVGLWRYLKLSGWPAELVLDYGRVEANGGAVAAAAMAVAALGWLAWKRPRAGFGGAVALLVLAPTAILPGAVQTLADHRMYLPLAAVVVGVAVTAVRWGGRWALGGLALAAVPLGVATVARNAVFADELRLWRENAAVRPQSAAAQSNLGRLLLQRGETAAAIAAMTEACRLEPTAPKLHYNLGLALDRAGRLDEAVAAFARAVALQPRWAEAQFALGLLHAARGEAEPARGCYEAAVAADPRHAAARMNLGVALAQAGRTAEARPHLAAAVALRPEWAEAHANLGALLSEVGEVERARTELGEALRLRPDYPFARAVLSELDGAR